ncbi:MAG: CHAD domain-containing protein [Alphaproteobacteria bacterium]|nr:CHAD domain-containing protein [Alphaproteobacteria bacterium]
MTERELKLAADAETIARIRKSKLVSSCATGPSRTRDVETTYFDVGDDALAKQKLAFRVRRDGKALVQTVKGECAMLGGVRDAIELTTPIAAPTPSPELIPDQGIRKRVEGLINGRGLTPRYSTHIRRTTRTIAINGSAIEIAFDVGEMRGDSAGHTAAPISEIELELVSGEPHCLARFARELAQEFPVRLLLSSKAERARDLEAERFQAPRKARTLVLTQAMAVEDGIAATLSHCLGHLCDNWEPVIVAGDPEGVHQMRVALRRMRSAIAVFGKAAQANVLVHLRAEAKWLADALGAARDLDVFVEETLEPIRAAFPVDRALKSLATIAEASRAEAWRELRAALETSRARLFVFDLAEAIQTRPWRAEASLEAATALAKPLPGFAVHALDKRWTKVSRLGEKLEELDIEGRHELRIALKKLRYAGEFFESLFAQKRARAYLRHVADLQDIFGALNDASVAETIALRLIEKGIASDPAGEGAIRWAGGLVTGWHAARVAHAWPNAKARWKDLRKHKAFWKD